jgi:hypothetical protein
MLVPQCSEERRGPFLQPGGENLIAEELLVRCEKGLALGEGDLDPSVRTTKLAPWIFSVTTHGTLDRDRYSLSSSRQSAGLSAIYS